MIVCAGQHYHLSALRADKHLTGGEGLALRHGETPRLLLAAAQRVNAVPAAQTRRIALILQPFIQQRETVVLQTRVCAEQTGVTITSRTPSEQTYIKLYSLLKINQQHLRDVNNKAGCSKSYIILKPTNN